MQTGKEREKELGVLCLDLKATESELRHYVWFEYVWDLKAYLHSDTLPPKSYAYSNEDTLANSATSDEFLGTIMLKQLQYLWR